MISIVTYGRNDNYGFNLAKRTALGFNCLAEVLTEEDEILFVDYNTPGHLPTLPEFIWDTLTDKALSLLKVIRISQDIHESIKADSPLPILENVSRNAAIVRSDPKNHWILSTNPDVLLVLSPQWKNLGELLRNIGDHFYEMPRFDIPESVWSSLNRTDAKSNMAILRDWLLSHGAAVAATIADHRYQKYLLFDAPGDFQLAPREHFFRLRGFDESMNKYLHSDSNLAKRMWLVNGCQTNHLLGHLWVVHQDHYLTGEWAKNVGTIVENDLKRKVLRQEETEANPENWGLQGISLPMFSLCQKVRRQRIGFFPSSASVNGDISLSREVDWQTQPVYRLLHYHPEVLTLYLRENLQVMPPESTLVYLGENPATLESLRRMWDDISPSAVPVQSLSDVVQRGESVAPGALLVDFYYERSEYWARRIHLVEEQMRRRLAKGGVSEDEAAEELGNFADTADTQAFESHVLPIWNKLLPYVRLSPGAYVVLMGSNQYFSPYFRFKRALAEHCAGLKVRNSKLQESHDFYQALKLRMDPENQRGRLLKALWRTRLLKRRVLRRLLGHESIMGFFHARHVVRETPAMQSLNLQTLYVHHRLIVMRVT